MNSTSPIPLATFEASVGNPLNARFFPPEAYTSEAFYRFELEAVWYREWICVGRLEEIPGVGDYFSLRVAGEPLLSCAPRPARSSRCRPCAGTAA